MTFEVWVIFIGTVLVLMSTPGPSQLLMLSNSIQNGFKRSLATAAGDLSANLLQMIVASIGLVSLIKNSHEFFIIIKWVGVAYLVYLGLKLIFSNNLNQIKMSSNRRSIKSLYWQGFITSAVNPKAVIFFAALFPQFINPAEPLLLQFLVLSITYLLTDLIFLSFYGKFSELIVSKLSHSLSNYVNKISGGFLVGAAILLGLKDIEIQN
ncbi:MAG: LysE family translocator [Cocleimonas sp.]